MIKFHYFLLIHQNLVFEVWDEDLIRVLLVFALTLEHEFVCGFVACEGDFLSIHGEVHFPLGCDVSIFMFSFDVVKGDVEALGDLYIELLSHVAHQELDQVGHRQDVGTSRKLNSNGVVILERQNLHVFYLRINLHLSQQTSGAQQCSWKHRQRWRLRQI